MCLVSDELLVIVIPQEICDCSPLLFIQMSVNIDCLFMISIVWFYLS